MGDLILPESVTDATFEHEAAKDHPLEAAREFRKWLKLIDERLDLVLAKPGAKAFPIPDRWYIIRRNEDVPVTFWVIQDEHGNYSEPTEAHMQKFRQGDTAANPRLWDEFQKARIARKLKADKAMEDKSEEFRTKLGERLKHLFDPQIFISSDFKRKLGDD